MEEKRDEKGSAAEFTIKDEANNTQVCEVCGTCFETRRGLSSHARSHLRQMGVCVSESSGAPITLLYHLITERDGKMPFSPKLSNTPNDPHPPKTLIKNKPTPGFDSKPCFRDSMAKADLGAKLKIKIGELVKRHSIGSSSKKSSSTSTSQSPVKPCTSPTKFSAQIQPAVPALLQFKPDLGLGEPASKMNLTGMAVASSCEMCGVWYETRKGLASHSRAHLRQLGVALDYKVSPIQVLHELLQKKEGKLGQAGEESLQAPPTGSMTPPPAKKRKSSITVEKTQGTVLKEVNCEFCGENFKNTQCLASHARSHLRHLGISDWGGTPIGVLREVMACRGSTSLPKPTQDAPTNAPATKPQKALSSSSSSSSSSPAKAPALLPDAPPTGPRSAQPAALCTKQPAALSASVPSAVLPPPVPGVNPGRVPKARKGTRTVVPKTKGEESHLNIPATEPTKAKSAASQSVNLSDFSLTSTNQIPASGLQEEVGVVESVQCSYCNDIFESRKALSCHARAHLRQLGVKWAQYTSPIDMLHELMIREGRGQGSEDMAKGRSTQSLTDFTSKEKTDCVDPGTTVCEATCELCGFDFENRKALASHARAHLRQLGEQWSSSQSPIEVLSMWMSREPEKVQQLHRLYQQGELPHIRKRRGSSLGFSFHGDSACSSVIRPSPSGRENKSGLSLSSHRKLSFHRPAINTAGGSTHFFQGCKPHHSKLLSHNLEGTEVLKRVGNPPSLVPPPPETSLVKLVGKIYSLKCRFCEQVFHGPLSIQEDWLIHLRHHILNPSPAPPQTSVDTAQLIGQAV